MADPIIVGGALLIAGVLTYVFWPSAAHAATPPTTTTAAGKTIPDVDLKTTVGYTDGFDAGHTDGYADGTAGKTTKNKRPSPTYSSDATQQAAYLLGYDPGYDTGWDEGLAFKAFTTDSTGGTDSTKTDVAKEKAKVGTPALGDKGYADGQSDGYYAGTLDYKNGVGDPSGSTSNRYHNLRNAVAGMPQSDAYKAGYVNGLDAGYSNGYNTAKAAGGGGDSASFSGRGGRGGLGGGRGRMSGSRVSAPGALVTWQQPYTPQFVRA